MAETAAGGWSESAGAPSMMPEQTLAAAVAEALRRHREAIIAGDPGAIARWTEELSCLLQGVDALLRQPSPQPEGRLHEAAATSGIIAAAQELQDAVRMNLMLAQNGIVIAHQFAAAVAEASTTDDAALFVGVA